MKIYNLSFIEILENINNYELGTIIESENEDMYKLSKPDIGCTERKFSRMKNEGTSLRFMTYDNSKRMFRIVEAKDEEIDIDSIEEVNHYDVISLVPGRTFENINVELAKYSLAINKLIKAVKQINNKLKEK